MTYANLSIAAKLDGKYIETGYAIKRDGYFFKNGTTKPNGHVLVAIPIGSNYTVLSINIDNQTYYSSKKDFSVAVQMNYRADLRIVPPGEISVSHSLERTNNKIKLKISASGPYSNPSYCLDWSAHFLWIKDLNQTERADKYFPKYVRCFDMGKDLNNEEFIVELQYKEWGNMEELDHAKIYIFDKGHELNETIYENYGGKDIEYTITGF